MIDRPDKRTVQRELPTTGLYLQDALEASGFAIDWEVCRAGPFSFRFGDRLVVVRYVTGEEIDLARSIRSCGGRIIYIVDDDLEAIIGDEGLPVDYRARIESFVTGPFQELSDLVDEILVSSSALADRWRRFGMDRVTCLDPYWPIPLELPSANEAPKIAWLGTRSHAADLESIADTLARVHSRHQRARLTVRWGKNRPRWLKRLPRVENLKPLPWSAYRPWLVAQRFDIALYPLLDTATNRCRSINKFLEHAVPGAASIISANAPFTDRLEPGDCLVVESGGWEDALETLLGDPDQRLEMAHRARCQAREIAETARKRQVEFWSQRFSLLEPC